MLKVANKIVDASREVSSWQYNWVDANYLFGTIQTKNIGFNIIFFQIHHKGISSVLWLLNNILTHYKHAPAIFLIVLLEYEEMD